jgi:hypothetical protein
MLNRIIKYKNNKKSNNTNFTKPIDLNIDLNNNYFKLKQFQEKIRPFDLNKLFSDSKYGVLLHLTLTKKLIDYLINTEAFVHRNIGFNEYPLSLAHNSDHRRNSEQVFLYDFLRLAIEINGIDYKTMQDWEIIESDIKDGLTKNDSKTKKIQDTQDIQESKNINAKKAVNKRFIQSGFSIKDINAIFKSYQQVLIYTNKYLLEALFLNLFFTHKDLNKDLNKDIELLPEDKWHIQSNGLKCKLNFFKRNGFVFADLSFSNITLNHMKWGEYFIPGMIKTYFYLDKVNVKDGVPTWRLYKHYNAQNILLDHMKFLEEINESLLNYLNKDKVNQVNQKPDNNNDWQLVFLYDKSLEDKKEDKKIKNKEGDIINPMHINHKKDIEEIADDYDLCDIDNKKVICEDQTSILPFKHNKDISNTSDESSNEDKNEDRNNENKDDDDKWHVHYVMAS